MLRRDERNHNHDTIGRWRVEIYWSRDKWCAWIGTSFPRLEVPAVLKADTLRDAAAKARAWIEENGECHCKKRYCPSIAVHLQPLVRAWPYLSGKPPRNATVAGQVAG